MRCRDRRVIRGGRLGVGHGRPAGMSESHAGTSMEISISLPPSLPIGTETSRAVFVETQKVEDK